MNCSNFIDFSDNNNEQNTDSLQNPSKRNQNLPNQKGKSTDLKENLNKTLYDKIDSLNISNESKDPLPAENFKNNDVNLKKYSKRLSVPPPINTVDANLIAQKSLNEKLLSKISSPTINTIPCISNKIDPNGKVSIGVSVDRNKKYRRTMEDSHSVINNFCDVDGQLYAAIFDGHAGKQAAKWCGENFHEILKDLLSKNKGRPTPDTLNETFLTSDTLISSLEKSKSGCTAIVAYIEKLHNPSEDDTSKSYNLYCSNVGDARAVLVRNGVAVRLSYDHKGEDPFEAKRVIENGGFIINNRVNGVLAVTRALGDSSMKKVVVGNPYISCTPLLPTDDFLILGCDGLWDVISDQDAADLICNSVCAQIASDKLLQYAIDNFSTDNISIVVIKFNHT
ncbi:hypothetical protein BB558_004856 [Smittium angustum]|uniref:PPM-type phosphatase domain-containing protein n=1 Tax=Smittium angustum TaxID=133377 RepID=A0A2U1J2D3_SMIAN|nr:hypothetical protein BB558_004856 [Smittium angustum]